MQNTFGKNFQIQLFGESHQPFIGVTINNIASGITLDIEQIKKDLQKRKPSSNFNTSRIEDDDFQIISGYFNNKTTGAPLTILIPNKNINSSSYQQFIPRPSHADYAAYSKFNGFNDYRGGGMFSARITSAIVIAGSIAKSILKSHGIIIKSHIKKVMQFEDDNLYSLDDLKNCDDTFPLINKNLFSDIQNLINQIASDKDTVGGTIETGIFNIEPGIGEPFFDNIESKLSYGLFSIPSVKSVEFGLGNEFANHTGKQANDEFQIKNNSIQTKTNYNGGINGGISNGMPIIFKTTLKPIPSIKTEQNTIDLNDFKNTKLTINGRHDCFVLNRAIIIIESIAAISTVDFYTERYGYLWQKQNMD